MQFFAGFFNGIFSPEEFPNLEFLFSGIIISPFTYLPTLMGCSVSHLQSFLIVTVLLAGVVILMAIHHEQKARQLEQKRTHEFLEEGGKPSQVPEMKIPPLPCCAKALILLVLILLAIGIIVTLTASMALQRLYVKSPGMMSQPWTFLDKDGSLDYLREASWSGSVSDTTLFNSPFYPYHQTLLNETRILALRLFGSENFFNHFDEGEWDIKYLNLCNGTSSRAYHPFPSWSRKHPYTPLFDARKEVEEFNAEDHTSKMTKQKLLKSLDQLTELINLSDCSRFHSFFYQSVRKFHLAEIMLALTGAMLGALYTMLLMSIVPCCRFGIRKLFFFFVFLFIYLRWCI